MNGIYHEYLLIVIGFLVYPAFKLFKFIACRAWYLIIQKAYKDTQLIRKIDSEKLISDSTWNTQQQVKDHEKRIRELEKPNVR